MFEFCVSNDMKKKKEKMFEKEFQHIFKYLMTLIAKIFNLMLNRVGW